MIRTARLSLMLALFVATPLQPQSRQFDLAAAGAWVDTGIDLNVGDSLRITATGQLRYPNAPQASGPVGLPRSFTDLLRALPVNDAGRGAVVARIGSSASARPFFVGELLNYRAPVAGVAAGVADTARDRVNERLGKCGYLDVGF